MTARESGQQGGVATREGHVSICPLCGAPLKNGFYTEIGKRGGERATQTAGKNDTPSMSERGRLGGRGNKKEGRG